MFPISVGATYETVLTPDKVEPLLSRFEDELRLARKACANRPFRCHASRCLLVPGKPTIRST